MELSCGKSTEVRYDMIIRRYLLTWLVLSLELSDHVFESYYVTFKGSTEPMVGLGTYECKDLNIDQIKHEESFINSYVE